MGDRHPASLRGTNPHPPPPRVISSGPVGPAVRSALSFGRGISSPVQQPSAETRAVASGREASPELDSSFGDPSRIRSAERGLRRDGRRRDHGPVLEPTVTLYCGRPAGVAHIRCGGHHTRGTCSKDWSGGESAFRSPSNQQRARQSWLREGIRLCLEKTTGERRGDPFSSSLHLKGAAPARTCH